MKKNTLKRIESKVRKAEKKANKLRTKTKKAEKKVRELNLKAETYAKVEEDALDAEIIKALRKWFSFPNAGPEWKALPEYFRAEAELNCEEAKADAELIKALREWHDSRPPAKRFAWKNLPHILQKMTLNKAEANGVKKEAP